jgi:hypothetical protein
VGSICAILIQNCKKWPTIYVVKLVFFSTYIGSLTHTNFGCAASLTTLDKLVDKFSLPPVAPLIGSVIDDTNLTHVMRLAAYSSTLPTPTAMGQSFIIIHYYNRVL